jgi:hypothetical protein
MCLVPVTIELFGRDVVFDAVRFALGFHPLVFDSHEHVNVACSVRVTASDTPEQYDACVVFDSVNDTITNRSHRCVVFGLRDGSDAIAAPNEFLRVDLDMICPTATINGDYTEFFKRIPPRR